MSHENKDAHTRKEEKTRPEEMLPGWPGYRTRPGRSGLDPLDTRAEAGHMAGVFLRPLLTGTLRTKNPFLLTFLVIFGLGCFIPLIFAVIGTFQGYPLTTTGWILMGLLALAGLVLLTNLIRNLLRLLAR